MLYLSIMALDDDLSDLLPANGLGGTTDPTNEIDGDFPTELSAIFCNEKEKGPKVLQQLVDIANK